MNIKAIGVSNGKNRQSSFSAPDTKTPASSTVPHSPHDDVDKTSTDEHSDVIEVPVIWIPTGQSLAQSPKRGCGGQSNRAAVTLTMASHDAHKDQLWGHPPQGSDTEDADAEAVVRVRRPVTCPHGGGGGGGGGGRTLTPGQQTGACLCGACRERQEGRLTPVSDLLSAEAVDVTETEIEAVPVDQHFYNQWARVPREEDPDNEVILSTRKSSSVRTLSAAGSLKSYTLMNAIARDKQIPPDNYGGQAHHGKTGAGSADGGITSPPRRGLSPADVPRPRQAVSRLASGTPAHGDDVLPPLLSTRAKTALGTVNSDHLVQQRSAQTSPQPDGDADSSSHLGASRSPEEAWSAEKKLVVPSFMPKKQRSLTSASLYSKQAYRPPQCLALNTASLLFSEDCRQRYRHQAVQKRPRLAVQGKPAKEDAALTRNHPTEKKRHGGEVRLKPREMTNVQFIDLTEVKKLLLKDSRTDGSNEKGGVVTDRHRALSCPGRRRVVWSAAQRHHGGKAFGKLYDTRDASVSVGLPLNISAIASSAE